MLSQSAGVYCLHIIPFHFGFWAPVIFVVLPISVFRCGLTTQEIRIHVVAGKRGLDEHYSRQMKLSCESSSFAVAWRIELILRFQIYITNQCFFSGHCGPWRLSCFVSSGTTGDCQWPEGCGRLVLITRGHLGFGLCCVWVAEALALMQRCLSLVFSSTAYLLCDLGPLTSCLCSLVSPSVKEAE